MINSSSSVPLTLRSNKATACSFPAGQRLVAYGVCLLLSIAWTLYAGKDVPWDAIHYHLYSGFSAFSDRLGVDFFPAGPQTYTSPPYSHALLYLMVRAGWPSLAIGIALACLHSIMLCATWELARALVPGSDGTNPTVVTWAATALALANPVLLQELGSSFNDITTGMLALAGYVALVNAFSGSRIGLVALAGALLGSAAALKLSNAFFTLVPAVPLVVGCMTTTRGRLRALIVFSVCTLAAILAIGGPWAWRLEQTFGNPVFPVLNDVFHPPAVADTPPHAQPTSRGGFGQRLLNTVRDPRFAPSSFAEALARPFDMLQARRLIHTETMAADARYAGLVVMALLGLAVLAWHRQRTTAQTTVPGGRAYACLAMSFAIAWGVWLLISGNSRYFIPMACIAGVLLVAGLHRLFIGLPRVFGWALAVVLGVQALLLWQAAEFRWSPVPWTGPWLQPTIPQRLKTEPYVYLPMDSQSQSFLLPDLAPGSSFIGMGGGIDSPPESYNGRRARALIDANLNRLRMLKLVQTIESDGRPIAPDASSFDFPLRRLGLRVDTKDCDYIRYNGNSAAIERSGPRSGPRGVVYIYTCRVVPGPGLTDAELERKRIADRVLDRVEAACPEFFPPRGASSWRSGGIWRRNYGDSVVWLNDEGWVRFADLIRGGGDFVSLGREEDWIKAPQRLTCWRAGGRVHVERHNG